MFFILLIAFLFCSWCYILLSFH